ncbi:hypothetical protein EMIT0111MI5_50289 [Burkholderia sp. IT-111MI5]
MSALALTRTPCFAVDRSYRFSAYPDPMLRGQPESALQHYSDPILYARPGAPLRRCPKPHTNSGRSLPSKNGGPNEKTPPTRGF